MYSCDFPDERREYVSRISVHIMNAMVCHDVVLSCIYRFNFKLLGQLKFTGVFSSLFFKIEY